jgi:uroporphyrinogen-III synthase
VVAPLSAVSTHPALRVLVTRPEAQALVWVAQLQAAGLQAAGLQAVALPLIGIAPAPDGGAALREAWAGLVEQALVMFVSPNAVAHFFAQRPQGQAWPVQVVAASPGPGTSEALRAQGVPAACIAEPPPDAPQFDSVALWQQLSGQDWAGRAVLIVRGTGGRDWLAQQFIARGAKLAFVAAYQRAAPQFDAAQVQCLRAALAAPAQHLWFFSSSEAIDHLQAWVHTSGEAVAWPAAQALVTHPRIAERARALGMGHVHECRPALAAVLACIQSIAS